jgi:two-component system, NtrC family, sensor kinase
MLKQPTQKPAEPSTARSQREEWLELALQASQIGVWEYNILTGELLWSDSCASLLGITSDAIAGTYEQFLQRVHPDDRALLAFAQHQAIEAKTVYNLEFRIILPDGNWRWVLQRGQGVRDRDGTATRLLGILQEIGDREARELELKASQTFLNHVIDSLPDPVFVKDSQHCWVFLNQAFCNLMGRDRAELLGKSDYDFFPAEQADVFWEKDELVLTAGIENLNEEMITDSTGTTRFISTKKSAFKDAAGNKFLIGIIRDITEGKQVEEELRQKEAQYRSIFEAVSDGILIDDLETGRIVEANPTACRMHGYSYEELVGKSTLEIVHPDFQHLFPQFLETIQAGVQFECCAVGVRQDGTTFDLDVKGSLCTFKGKPHALAVVRDISDRKKAEAAVRESEQKYQQILDAIADMILVKGPKSRIVWANKAFRNYYGMSNEQLRDLIDAPFNEPDYTLQYIKDDAYVFETGQTLVIPEEPVTRFDGEVGSFHTVKSAIRNQEGQVVMTVGVSRDLSDRKRAEEELRQSQQKLALLVQQTPLAVIEWNTQMEVAAWNPAAESIFGYSSREVLGRHFSLLLPEFLREPIEQIGDKLLLQEGGTRSTNENITKDGRTIFCEWYNTPLVAPNGEIIGITSLALEITERKQAEQVLREREERLRNINNLIPGAIYQYETDLRSGTSKFTYISPRAKELFELEQFVLLASPDPVWAMIHPDDLPRLQASTTFAIESNTTWSDEFRIVTPSGKEKWVRGQSEPAEAPEGTARHNGIFIDISDRKVAEGKLKEKARRAAFRADVDAALTQNDSLQGILARCTDAVVKHLDAAFAWIWTLNPEENLLELQASSGIYTHLDGPHSRIPVGQYKIGRIAGECQPHLTNAVFDDPFVDRAWAKREGVVAFAGYPLIVDGGAIGVIAMFARKSLPESTLKALALSANEIALGIRRKQAEDALRQQTQQLEQTLRELKKTQAQLVQTEKMSSLGQMVAGIAHEINNPVNFIHGNLSHADGYIHDLLGLLKLYQKTYPNPTLEIEAEAEAIDLEFLVKDLSKLLSSMKIGSDRIRQIVLSLRNFSRLDEADMKPVNIHEGIDSTLLILQHRLNKIQVTQEYGNLPLVDCYAGQLNQVLMNILSNAIDAVEESGVRSQELEVRSQESEKLPKIRVRTEVISVNPKSKIQNPKWIAIRIIDNGSGIPEDIQKKLFDPFFTTKPVGQGTGLGLSISYQIIVEKHGGKLQCISTPGQGTEFRIEIPIQQKQI